MNRDQQVCPCGATLGGSNHNPEHPLCHQHQRWVEQNTALRHQRLARFLEGDLVQIDIIRSFDGSRPLGDAVLQINCRIIRDVATAYDLMQAVRVNLPWLAEQGVGNIAAICGAMGLLR